MIATGALFLVFRRLTCTLSYTLRFGTDHFPIDSSAYASHYLTQNHMQRVMAVQTMQVFQYVSRVFDKNINW
jgi:hypothetical protein